MKKLGKWFLLFVSFLIWNLFPLATLIILERYFKSTSILVSIVNIFYSILYMFILFVIFRKDLLKSLKIFNKNLISNLEDAFKWWLLGFIIMIISNGIIVYFTPNNIAGNEQAVRSMLEGYPVYMTFSAIIFAPFVEEIIFRKSFRDIFKNKWLFIIISGFTFGSLHVFSSFDSIWNLLHLIPYCSLGCVLAYAYYKTDNIFTSISMHFFHNSLTLILLLAIGGISL